jgi:hypothetical protein
VVWLRNRSKTPCYLRSTSTEAARDLRAALVWCSVRCSIKPPVRCAGAKRKHRARPPRKLRNEPVAETTESDARGNERLDLASVLDQGSARAESDRSSHGAEPCGRLPPWLLDPCQKGNAGFAQWSRALANAANYEAPITCL